MAQSSRTCPEMFTLVLVAVVLSVNLTVAKNVPVEKATSIPQSPPQFVEELAKPNVTTEVRQNAKLYCPFVGAGTVIYEWYKGEDRIQKGLGDWDRFGPDAGKSITIRSVTPQDAGIYRCRAVNGFGSRYYSIELFVSGKNSLALNVLKPPKYEDYQEAGGIKPQISIVNMPRAGTIKEFRGKNVNVLCEASGTPNPQVAWFKDGRNVTGVTESASKLHLSNITDKDNGRYKCEARNSVGVDVFEVSIEVAEAYLGTVEVKAVNPSNLTLVAGQSGNITCVASIQGPATPFVVWVKKVESQSESDSHDKLVEHEGNYYKYINRTGTEVSHIRDNLYSTTLTFVNATYADAGTYHCAAVGPTGINNHVVHVFVKEDLEKAAIRESQKSSSSIQRAILLAFAFLILAGIVGACLVRLYGCRGSLKKPQHKVNNNISRRLPVVRSRTTTAMADLPKRSPGETMSTTLTTSHHPTDVLQPLVSPTSFAGRNSHQTVSTAISASRNLPATANNNVARENSSKSRNQVAATTSHSSKYLASQRLNSKRPSQLGRSGHQKSTPPQEYSSSDSEETSVSKFMPHPSPSLASWVDGGAGASARYLVNSVNCGDGGSHRYCPQGCCCDDNSVDSHAAHQQQDGSVAKTAERKSRRSRFNQHHHFHHHHHNALQPIDPALSTSDTCIPPVPAPSSTCSSISFPSSAYSSGSSHAQCTREGFHYYRNSRQNHQKPPQTFSHNSDRLLNSNAACKYCNS